MRKELNEIDKKVTINFIKMNKNIKYKANKINLFALFC